MGKKKKRGSKASITPTVGTGVEAEAPSEHATTPHQPSSALDSLATKGETGPQLRKAQELDKADQCQRKTLAEQQAELEVEYKPPNKHSEWSQEESPQGRAPEESGSLIDRDADLWRIFKIFDLDGSGAVGAEEMMKLGKARRALGQKGGTWDKSKNDALLESMGANDEGSVSGDKFVEYFNQTMAKLSDKDFSFAILQFTRAAELCMTGEIKEAPMVRADDNILALKKDLKAMNSSIAAAKQKADDEAREAKAKAAVRRTASQDAASNEVSRASPTNNSQDKHLTSATNSSSCKTLAEQEAELESRLGGARSVTPQERSISPRKTLAEQEAELEAEFKVRSPRKGNMQSQPSHTTDSSESNLMSRLANIDNLPRDGQQADKMACGAQQATLEKASHIQRAANVPSVSTPAEDSMLLRMQAISPNTSEKGGNESTHKGRRGNRNIPMKREGTKSELQSLVTTLKTELCQISELSDVFKVLSKPDLSDIWAPTPEDLGTYCQQVSTQVSVAKNLKELLAKSSMRQELQKSARAAEDSLLTRMQAISSDRAQPDSKTLCTQPTHRLIPSSWEGNSNHTATSHLETATPTSLSTKIEDSLMSRLENSKSPPPRQVPNNRRKTLAEQQAELESQLGGTKSVAPQERSISPRKTLAEQQAELESRLDGTKNVAPLERSISPRKTLAEQQAELESRLCTVRSPAKQRQAANEEKTRAEQQDEKMLLRMQGTSPERPRRISPGRRPGESRASVQINLGQSAKGSNADGIGAKSDSSLMSRLDDNASPSRRQVAGSSSPQAMHAWSHKRLTSKDNESLGRSRAAEDTMLARMKPKPAPASKEDKMLERVKML